MLPTITGLTLLIDDYDAAIQYYTEVFNFVCIENEARPGTDQRWVTLAANHESELKIILTRAETAREKQLIGQQAADRVFLILQTDNFWRDYKRLQPLQVTFLEEPRTEVYGTVVILKDRYGNRWDLIETLA